ncbi:MAG TPA: NnrS family protein [Terriglobales bacterium]|nr:NnrS family protein [Terriglobales bacterium]
MVITENTSVAEVVQAVPGARRIFDRHGLHGCGGAHGPSEPLSFFAAVHQVELKGLLEELNVEAARPQERVVYRESLEDYIYRRFFKAGIFIVLTVGALWGAVNLAQIAIGKSFLQLHLVQSIHAHAHAMIFGWVGLFVMGFALQSFPRFKNTTLWRPDLANLSFYLMVTGIIARMSAELLIQTGPGLALGFFSGVVELISIVLFLTVLYKTATKSVGPRNPYERFIAASFFWFFVQALLSDFFFFAKATAIGQQQLIRRIALIDGPLRDIQLLGFTALIIAGVSQRFVPLVYGLKGPKKDRQGLIFALMNLTLVLNVISYVAVLTTGNLAWALGLEIAYLLMPVWAVLLAIQLGVFSKPTQPDRTFKFIRGAYVWLIIANAMMPFFLVYGIATHQGFAHAYMGAHRHAFTVGFISMMIMGVAARVVPILAGVNASRLSNLWGPFLLLTVGNSGRVLLQIATDFYPNVAYPLVGLTGFLEVTALAWWGIGLWRVMNLSHSERPKVLAGPLPILAQ